MNILFYFLPAIIILGILTSYEDLKTGKIRNKYIISALIYAFIVYIVLFTISSNSFHFIELLTNILFTILIGFGFWYFKIWTAGDGKLFIAFSALLPLSTYQIGYQKYIPSITLLINIFIPALIITLVFALYKAKKIPFKIFLKDIFNPKQILNAIINLFAILWIVQLFFSLINFNNPFLRISLTIFIFYLTQKKLKNKAIYLTTAVSLIRLVIDTSIYSFSFLISFLILILILRFLMVFLEKGVSILGIKKKETIPFAPFVFLGVILTIISNGNVLIVIKNLI